MSRWSFLLVCVVLASFGTLFYLANQTSQVSPIRELHMVEVLGKPADRVYQVFIPAQFNPGKTDQGMVIRLCDDGDDLPLKTGMVMKVFQYRQRRDCLLIDGSTFVGYLRDDHGKHSRHSRQSTIQRS